MYVPTGTSASTLSIPLAVPPSAEAGVTSVSEIEPPAGAGVTGPNVSEVTVPSASVAEAAAVAPWPWSTDSGAGHVTTTGAFPPETACEPSPSNVFVGNPSHSTAGSKASPPFGSPAVIVALRRSVLSAVLVSPDPHSVPGSKPTWPITSSTVVPLRSTTASSPLNQPEPFVWSACARIAGSALDWARTNTSPSATVPVRLIVSEETGLPLKNICTL